MAVELAGRIVAAEHAQLLLNRSFTVTAAESIVQRTRAAALKRIGEAYEAARRRGYQDGLAAAYRDSLATLDAARRRRRVIDESLPDTVLAVATKVLGELPADVLLPKLIAIAIADLQEPPDTLVVEVHPDLVRTVRAVLKTSLGVDGAAGIRVQIQANDALAPTDCCIDLGDSVIDAGLFTQLAAVHRALSVAGLDGDSVSESNSP